jgi:hypothetical protein
MIKVVTSRYLLHSVGFRAGTAVYWYWSRLSGCVFRITAVPLSEIKVGMEVLWVIEKLSGMDKLS